jgi:hypothetical protein
MALNIGQPLPERSGGGCFFLGLEELVRRGGLKNYKIEKLVEINCTIKTSV